MTAQHTIYNQMHRIDTNSKTSQSWSPSIHLIYTQRIHMTFWFKHILLTPKQVKNLYKWISIRIWLFMSYTHPLWQFLNPGWLTWGGFTVWLYILPSIPALLVSKLINMLKSTLSKTVQNSLTTRNSHMISIYPLKYGNTTSPSAQNHKTKAKSLREIHWKIKTTICSYPKQALS